MHNALILRVGEHDIVPEEWQYLLSSIQELEIEHRTLQYSHMTFIDTEYIPSGGLVHAYVTREATFSLWRAALSVSGCCAHTRPCEILLPLHVSASRVTTTTFLDLHLQSYNQHAVSRRHTEPASSSL